MNLTNLHTMFRPTSVAVIGATDEPGTPGAVILRNLQACKFIGPIIPVHETLTEVAGLPVYREIDTLPLTPDLAIICSEPETVPDYVLQLGHRGVAGAVILGTGFAALPSDVRKMLEGAILSAARRTDLRILGVGSMGFICPGVGINASLAHTDAKPGRIAFVTQSDSLFTTVLDWANMRNIGFSYFISLGTKLDFGFGTILDFLNSDPNTRAVLLYVEDIERARQFMSAARATARNKPVVVIKAGRTAEAAREMARFKDGPLGQDAVYDAAFRRAGMLRVYDTDALFDSVETIARSKPFKGERLAIVVNGMSPGLITMDRFIEGGGVLAELVPDTREKLGELLADEPMPGCNAEGCIGNPVNIAPNAPPERYAEALRILLKAPDVDAVLVMHFPSALVDGREVAQAVAEVARRAKRLVLTSWVGGGNAEAAREVFNEESIPVYSTPDKAVRAYLNLVHYRRNQDMLVETPASLPSSYQPDTATARRVLHNALDAGRDRLTVPEAMDILAAYQIPVVDTRLAATAEGAVEAANELGYPVAIKVLSPDLRCKSKAGGVALDLDTPEAVADAAAAVMHRVCLAQPDCCTAGFIVQRMGRRPRAHELFIQMGTDPIFGPYIRFGQGGSESEIIGDAAVTLPPLNMALAKELISRTFVSRLLQGHADRPPADIEALCQTLNKVSQLIVDLPEIVSLEINPLFADEQGVLALDADVEIAEAEVTGPERLAIRPYPRELEECIQLPNGMHVTLRPIRPEDEPAHWDFLSRLSIEDIRYRFFGLIRELPRSEMIRLTQIDYDREMAFIASLESEDGPNETLGVVRGMTKPDNSAMEFAIIVRSDIKRQSLGKTLMRKLIGYARTRGTRAIIGEALMENAAMAALAGSVGFTVTKSYDDDVYKFRMDLDESQD
ncbi:acetyltransferase [Desulfobaculum xiamenense]|uniref:Acetyltransferase n=1 Tax=Desulfobaculum xiamenense TaxID=995050 RepID=A0A846QK29_9BACT|nr:bifunctional acetate--CoA ligase family protein/GNAT family N-acetyltransferase [Desulfobaculum xiamenense]NJB69266.1 acetyltransferase [Desulfobaculum xiamenense]